MKKNILLTNDDGYKAMGVEALYSVLKELYNVYMVVPATEQSAKSQAISPRDPLRVVKISDFVYTVDGTPADCVHIAKLGFLSHIKFDAILSGINLGANVSYDIFYSGTVGAAFEGALQGVSSIAFSYVSRHDTYLNVSANNCISIVEQVLQTPLPPLTMLNVNLPHCPLNEVKGMQWTYPGNMKYQHPINVSSEISEVESFWKYGSYIGHENIEGSDCQACANNYISVSPLYVSCYNPQKAEEIKKQYHFKIGF